jgi:hypothetical protein
MQLFRHMPPPDLTVSHNLGWRRRLEFSKECITTSLSISRLRFGSDAVCLTADTIRDPLNLDTSVTGITECLHFVHRPLFRKNTFHKLRPFPSLSAVGHLIPYSLKRNGREATTSLGPLERCYHVRWVPCYYGMARPQVADGDGLQIG